MEFFTPFTNSKITAPYALQKLTDQKLSFEFSHYIVAYQRLYSTKYYACKKKKSGAFRWVMFDTLGCLHGVFNLSYEPDHFLTHPP